MNSALFGSMWTYEEMISDPPASVIEEREYSINSEKSKKILDDMLFDAYNNDMSVGEFITKPIHHLLDNPNYTETLGVSKIITASTGGGKTHLSISDIIPRLFLEDVAIAVYIVPDTSLFDRTLYERELRKSQILKNADIQPAIVVDKDIYELETYVTEYSHIFIATTRQMFASSIKRGKSLANLIINLEHKFGIKSALIYDEAHIASTSSKENYKNNTGSTTPIYNATYYNKIKEISFFTHHIYGLTGTETFEQTGELEVVDHLKYSVVNEKPNRYKISGQSAWLSNIRYKYNYKKGKKYNVDNVYNMKEETSKFFKAYLRMMRKYPSYKQSMLIKTGRKNGIMNLEDSLEYFKNLVLDLSPEFINKEIFAEVTESGGRIYKINHNGEFQIRTESEFKVLKNLNDLKNELRFLFLVEKGTLGINVNTLKWLVTYRTFEPEGVNGQFVKNSAKQLVGRLVRPYFTISNAEFKEKYNNKYNTFQYIKDMDYEEFKGYMDLNTINLLTCNNSYWDEVVGDLTKQTLIWKSEAETYHNFRRQVGN